MFRSYRVATIFGLPIYVHASLPVVLVVALIVISLTTSARGDARLDTLLAMLALLVLFVLCLLLHELGHAFTARRLGIGCRRVLLHGLGAVAEIEAGRLEPRKELRIALAGPLVNLAIALIVGALLLATGPSSFLALLLLFNLGLALINLLPGFLPLLPGYSLDGGRVLRSALAHRRSHAQATLAAAKIAWWTALALIVFAIAVRIGSLVIFGFFLLLGAWAEKQKARFLGIFDQFGTDPRAFHEMWEQMRRGGRPRDAEEPEESANESADGEGWGEEEDARERSRVIDVEARTSREREKDDSARRR